MNTQPDSREWETLSAYLDGALSPTEKQRLEARLQTSPELQQILHELRITRALLRSVPRRRAPRNFTLTPQMAGIHRQQRPAWLVPMFSMSSALATLLLVITLFVEMFAAPSTAAPMNLVAAPSDAQPQAEMNTLAALELTETPMIITWGHPGMGGGGGMDLPYGMAAEGKGGGGEPAPMMNMEAPAGEAEAKQAPLEESAWTAEDSAAGETDFPTQTEEMPLAEAAAPMLPDQAADTLPMTEESAPAFEPATATQEKAYPEAEFEAQPTEEPLPTDQPQANEESARGYSPTAAPRIYEGEELPSEAQPPLVLETPETLQKESVAGEVIIFGLPSPEDAGQIMPTSPALAKGAVEESTPADQAAPVQQFDWKIARVILLFIAAFCGGLAFILHRKNHS